MNMVCGMWYMELPLCPHHNIHVHVPYAHMSHHLHLMLLYSPQHLLPTSSALHHDDPSDWPYTMELYCPGKGVKEQNKSKKQIHITTSMYMYGKYAMGMLVPSITLRELDTEYLVSEGRGKRQRDGIHFPNPINKFDG